MGIEFISEYVVYVVVGVCLCVGYVIKHVVPSEKVNRFIPLILAVLGLLMNVWVKAAITPEVVLGGLASGLVSVGLHQVFKQFIEKE